MKTAPVLQAAWAGASRRLMQSVIVFVVLAVSSTSALTGLALYTGANAATRAGVAVTHGADLEVTVNPAKVNAGQLVATSHLPGVTQNAGPYPEATITVAAGPAAVGKPGGVPPTKLTVVGRASPSGPLDDVILRPGQSRWPASPGQISLGASQIGLNPGSKLTVISAPGRPRLTITGYAEQVEIFEDAWVLPSEIAALRATGAPAREEMLYSFSGNSTAAQLDIDLAKLKAALPPGAIVSSRPLSSATDSAGPGGNVNTPFVVAFALLGLVLALLITANVVSAAVIASYRRIGVLKSIGYTPAQVTATYLAQISVPALAGTAAGTILGNVWVLPVLSMYKVRGAQVSVPLWINLTVPLVMVALAGLAAAVPAARAGRLSAVEAITAGQAPRTGRGALAHRLIGRLGLPAPVAIGLAAPFSRPARSAVTLAALLFGLTAVVLGSSLNASIHKINHSALRPDGQLQVSPGGEDNTLSGTQAARVLAAIRRQPGTRHYVAETDLEYDGITKGPNSVRTFGPNSQAPTKVAVAGQPRLSMMTYAYNGDASWLGYALTSGHWYNGPGQIDVNTNFVSETGWTTGDTITLTVDGKPIRARIVGEVFIPNGLPTVFVGWPTLGGAAAGLTTNQFDVALTPDTNAQAYINTLQRALPASIGIRFGEASSFAGFLDRHLFSRLAVLLAVLAGLGVLNAALMATRERVHDLGVFRAIGMTPAQTITMVICWVIVPAIIATAVALPTGLTVQDHLVYQLANSPLGGSARTVLPADFVHVLSTTDLLLLALVGMAIAIAGALGPAAWAVRARTSTVLHAE